LTPQGKVLHDFFIVADPGPDVADGAVLLDVEAVGVADLLERLRRYRLRAKVTLEDVTSFFGSWALMAGDNADVAASAVALPVMPGATAAFAAGGVAFVDPRLAALGVRLLVPRNTAAAALAAVGAGPGTYADYDRHRLALGVPEGQQDLAAEPTLALEGNLDALNAISWTKGCYVGQEVTARTRYRGLVRRRLRPVQVLGGLPEPGTPVRQGDSEVGVIRSGVDGVALALLRLDIADPRVAPLTAGSATVSPLEPGWTVPA
jgi:hypothetical protein